MRGIENRFTIIDSFEEDMKLNSKNIHYLDPENDAEDEKFMKGIPTKAFHNGYRQYVEYDKVDGIYWFVYNKPVIYRDILSKWLEREKVKHQYTIVAKEATKKVRQKGSVTSHTPIFCDYCGLEKWSKNFVKWDGEFKYSACDCY